MVMDLTKCLLILPLVWHVVCAMHIPEVNVDAAENLIKSFVLWKDNKEYRWEAPTSDEPFDEVAHQEGDVLEFPEMLTDEFIKRKVSEAKKLWKNGVIPWAFNQYSRQFTTTKATALVKKAFLLLEKFTCLKFPEWSPQRSKELGRNYLDIGQGKWCASYVGYYGRGPQPVLLNQKGCMKLGIIMHEICHALGFFHEHSRTDRDKYIRILFENTKTASHVNFKIHSDSHNYALYDLESILHYGPKAFSRSDDITIQPKDDNLSFLLGQRSKLSFYDIKTITDAYQCTNNCKEPHQRCRNGGFLDATCKCHCPYGLKGVDCSAVINNKACGGITTLTLENQETVISFSSKSLGEDRKIQCFWLVKVPLMTRMRLNMIEFNLKMSNMLCKQWLEVRYNMIGQRGPKYCGDLTEEMRSFESTSNLVLLAFESSMIPIGDAKFKMSVNLITENDTDIDCTFELGNDLCIFHQVVKDDFDWILSQGPSNAGPAGGNNGSERYLYIGTSSPRRPGDTAILESRYIPAGNKCISIHYNIYGENIGQLKMNLLTSKGHSLGVFHEEGSKDTDWKMYAFSVEAPLPFKVIIEATVGDGTLGNIAIDDISIKSGMCNQTKVKATLGKQNVTQMDCDFEEDACNFTWTPQSIAKVINSSLSGDASLIGCLLIFTWTLKDGEEATIASPVMPYHGASCLSVSYYVIGIAQWNLSLSVADPATNQSKILWTSNSIGEIKGKNNMITEEITESFRSIQIILTVMVVNNSSNASLVAIDHIRLIADSCKNAQVRLPFGCDFNNWCGFTSDGDWEIASEGVIFGPFTSSHFQKKSFLLYQGLLSKSPGQSSVVSPPISLLGEGCLSFNFFARGILLKGIMLQQKMMDDRSNLVWESSKIMLMAVWARIQIPLTGDGEFRIVFSTIGKDMFANYAIDNLMLDPISCTTD